MVDLWLGQQLRQLRRARGRSLAQVADACDISVGLLSQIERGLSSISIRTLQCVAGELGADANALLRTANQRQGEAGGRVARAGSHRLVPREAQGVIEEIVTPSQSRGIDLCRVTIAPGGGAGAAPARAGAQVGVVLEGMLELWIENDVVLLQAGDSFCYAARAPRRWRNPGSTATQVIWAVADMS